MCKKNKKVKEEIVNEPVEQVKEQPQDATTAPKKRDYFAEYYNAYKNDYIDQYINAYKEMKKAPEYEDVSSNDKTELDF